MNIYDFTDNFDQFTMERKIKGLRAIFDALIEQVENGDNEVVIDILDTVIIYNNDDYFGSEGLDV